ncbi:MAG: biotin/lipoyl-containing protein, partial [Alphaproteobacteria bacterium]
GRLEKLYEMRAQRAAMLTPGGTAKLKIASDDSKTKSVIKVEHATKRFPRSPFASSEVEKRVSTGAASPLLDTNGVRVRVDDGVFEGGEVSMFYDPMVAKLITWGPGREAAIDAQIAALDAFELDGIGDNVDFLSALMQHPRFRSGDITTNFIAEEYPEGFQGAPADAQLMSDITVIGGMIGAISEERAAQVDGQLGPPITPSCERIVIVDPGSGSGAGAEQHRVRIKPYQGGTLAVLDGGELIDVIGRWSPGQRLLSVTIDGRPRTVKVIKSGRSWLLNTRGATHKVQVLGPHVAELKKHMIDKPPPDLSRLLLAPMPGLLTRLDVEPGDTVEPGQPVAVMEAMKMENILRAPRAATVKATPAKAGDSLAVDQVIVEFE